MFCACTLVLATPEVCARSYASASTSSQADTAACMRPLQCTHTIARGQLFQLDTVHNGCALAHNTATVAQLIALCQILFFQLLCEPTNSTSTVAAARDHYHKLCCCTGSQNWLAAAVLCCVAALPSNSNADSQEDRMLTYDVLLLLPAALASNDRSKSKALQTHHGLTYGMWNKLPLAPKREILLLDAALCTVHCSVCRVQALYTEVYPLCSSHIKQQNIQANTVLKIIIIKQLAQLNVKFAVSHLPD
eukprot:14933-Heterococcus_DN1.PRE.4